MYNGLKLNLKNDDHVVLKKYLSENSLVESNLKIISLIVLILAVLVVIIYVKWKRRK